MILRDVVKLDQKNRCRIPALYLDLCGIDKNTYVAVEIDSINKVISLGHISTELQGVLEGLEDAGRSCS